MNNEEVFNAYSEYLELREDDEILTEESAPEREAPAAYATDESF